MPDLVLIRGLPGSGKSTLARQFARRLGFAHVEADMYFERAGVYQYDPQRIADAHLWCRETVTDLLECGRDVVVANTFSTMWEMREYEHLGLYYRLYITECSGKWGSIHNVPQHTIDKMAKRWETLPECWRGGPKFWEGW